MKTSVKIFCLLLLTVTFSWPQTITKLKMFGGEILSYHSSADGSLYAGTVSGVWKISPSATSWERITGLHNYRVNAINYNEQTTLLFAGTDKGLVKFNGANWSYASELKDVAVNALLRVGQTQLLVATGQGLYRHYAETGITVKLTDKIPEDVFRSLYADAQGRIWAGAAQGKIFQLDAECNFIALDDLNVFGDVVCFAEDSTGAVLAGTEGNGIYIKSTGSWGPFSTGLITTWIFDLFKTSSGAMLVSTPGGMQTNNGFSWTGKISGPANSNMVKKFAGRNGTTVLGTDGAGNHLMNGENFITEKLNLGFEAVSVNDFVSSGDYALVAAKNSGVLFVDTEKPDDSPAEVNTGFSENNVNSFSVDQAGAVYASTSTAVYSDSRFPSPDELNWYWQKHEGFGGSFIVKVVSDTTGTFVPNGLGIFKIKQGEQQATKVTGFTDSAQDIIHSGGKTYVATYGDGLYVSNDGGDTFEKETAVDQDYISGLYQAGDGSLWVHSFYGVYMKGNNTAEWEAFQADDIPSKEDLAAFVANGEDHITVACGNKMMVYDNGVWTTYDKSPVGDSVSFYKQTLDEGDIIYENITVIKKTGTDKVYLVGTDGGGAYLFDLRNVTGAGTKENTPAGFALAQNYPNPFNPSTTIEYTIAKPSAVRLEIFNCNGERIAELVNEHKPAGTYNARWNGRNNKGNKAGAGIYFYRLKAGELLETKKMILLK